MTNPYQTKSTEVLRALRAILERKGEDRSQTYRNVVLELQARGLG